VQTHAMLGPGYITRGFERPSRILFLWVGCDDPEPSVPERHGVDNQSTVLSLDTQMQASSEIQQCMSKDVRAAVNRG